MILFLIGWVACAVIGWMFVYGAGKASEQCDPPLDPDEERAAHRAAVDAGYASLAGYVSKYGKDAK
jgi:hypothetical protein